MKSASLFVAVVLFLSIGCSSDKNLISNDFNIAGNWTGMIEATYPGPDDGPVTVSDGINFVFYEDGRYDFFWEPFTGPSAFASGQFTRTNDSIHFVQVTRNLTFEPYNIKNSFTIFRDGDSLYLNQTLYPDTWPVIHKIELTPGQIIF